MKTTQFAVRRRIAKTSFAAILFTLGACLSIAAWGDTGAAERLLAATGIILPIVGCLTALIGQYAHQVFKTDSTTTA
jgi:hypothetical protein